MAVIKSQSAPASLRPFSMTDVEEAAKKMLLRARQQAEELLAVAQQQADELKELARAEGAQEGFEQGRAEGIKLGQESARQTALAEQRQQLTDAVQALSTAALTLEAHRKDLETQALSEVVSLACAIARRVTKRQALVDESVLSANVSEAMKLVVAAADIRIAIHPVQRKTMESTLPALRLQWPALKHVELVDDPTLAAGGCRIHTQGGCVDADLDGQLDRVIADLLPEAGASPGMDQV